MLINMLIKVFDVLQTLIMIHILLSWVPINNDFKKLIDGIVNPMLKPFRAILPIGGIYLDLAPIIFLFLVRITITTLIKFFY